MDTVGFEENSELPHRSFWAERGPTFPQRIYDHEVTALLMMRNRQREAVGRTTRGVNKGVIPDIPRSGMFPHTHPDAGLDRLTEDEGFQIGAETSPIFSLSINRVTLGCAVHDRRGQSSVHGAAVSLSDEDERITSGAVVLTIEVPQLTTSRVG
jgi:hypothetical protein